MFELSIWWRFFILIVGVGLGFFCLIKTLTVRNLIGALPWAERHLGAGGTYSMVKLIGIGLILVAFFLFVNG